MWTFLEKKSGTGASGVITFSGLDGDTDKWYRIAGMGKSSSSDYHALLFNGSTTNNVASLWSDNSGTWTHSSTSGRYTGTSTANPVQMEALIYADKTAADNRAALTTSNIPDTSIRYARGLLVYTDTTTNITSLALSLGLGNWSTSSHFYLYKLTNP